MSCSTCPAALVIEGAAPGERKVLCRAESTTAGERDESAGPLSFVRERTSPASLHGYCLGDLRDYAEHVTHELGPLATDEQRRVAEMVRAADAGGGGYVACPSWRAEFVNRHAAKLVDLPGRRRVHGADGAREVGVA